MMGHVPNELLLDIAKLMSYRELCTLQLVNARFDGFVDRYKHELPLCKLYQLEFVPDVAITLHAYRQTTEITEHPYGGGGEEQEDGGGNMLAHPAIQDEDKKKWDALLEKQVPFYAFPDYSVMKQPPRHAIESFLLLITRKDGGDPSRLCLELPYWPETQDDLLLCRFWLDQLARVHFHWVDCGRVFFHPEVLRTLVPVPKCRELRFHSRRIQLKVGIPDEAYNEHFLQFALNHVVTECLTLRCRQYFEGVLQLLLKAGPRIGKVVFPSGPGNATVELQNLLIFHAERALDLMGIVAQIDFLHVQDLPWPDVRTAKFVVQTEEDDDDMAYKKYALASLRNPGHLFEISIGFVKGIEPCPTEFKRFSIKRLTSQ